MGRLRVSIAGLMALIALAALVLASLREAGDLWSRAMFTLALGVQALALLGVALDLRERRPGWLGCLVCGGGYLAACFAPGFDTHVMPRLISTALLDGRYAAMSYMPRRDAEKVWLVRPIDQIGGVEAVEARVYDLDRTPAGWARVAMENGTTSAAAPSLRPLSPDAFRQLGHAELSLILGVVGALLARLFAARREADRAPVGDESPEGRP